MYVVVEYRGLVGPMRIVARGATGFLHRIVQMDSCECGLVGLVALDAERRNLGGEKLSCFFRGVRIMTAKTSGLNRAVPEFNVGKCVPHVLVALETQLVSGLEQVPPVIGAVRVVAHYAFTLHHDLV